jgi:carboxylesterase type B
MHSGSGNALTRAQADRGGVELAHRLGCDRPASADTLACLRAAAPDAIATALPESLAPGGIRFGPVIDGWLLPARPIELVARGDHNHVPLVVSTTTREFSTMVQGYLDGPCARATGSPMPRQRTSASRCIASSSITRTAARSRRSEPATASTSTWCFATCLRQFSSTMPSALSRIS